MSTVHGRSAPFVCTTTADVNVQRCVAVCVGCVRALLDEPVFGIARILFQRQRSPLTQPAAPLHIAGIEHRPKLREIVIGEQPIEVL
ncbi:hypothetical protein [Burkholderia lata]|uniref:hypothetical protein n=1 Tax=Burkholderia lata (strain ATCC 17760 / DSM 23089 / LMG 22485 / NCIMB 9086 / R18194 / 383) TaxID=482957 RepID=UPI001581D55F|nr:hypothetical protein [Burkholderia lata]